MTLFMEGWGRVGGIAISESFSSKEPKGSHGKCWHCKQGISRLHAIDENCSFGPNLVINVNEKYSLPFMFRKDAY